jgi:hypothetical protein
MRSTRKRKDKLLLISAFRSRLTPMVGRYSNSVTDLNRGRSESRRQIVKRSSRQSQRYLLLLFIGCAVTFFLAFAIQSIWPSVVAAPPSISSPIYSRTVGYATPRRKSIGRTTIPVCSHDRRRANCLVDGDTGWEAGKKWRLEAVDTPELSSPACAAEHVAAVKALRRLQQLMRTGYRIKWTGRRGRYQRYIIRIRLADGRDAGHVLVSEGLAQPWPNYGNVWCSPGGRPTRAILWTARIRNWLRVAWHSFLQLTEANFSLR